MVVWKVVPCGAVFAVVLAHGAPLTVAQIRSPAAPTREVRAMKTRTFLRLEQIDCACRLHGTSRPKSIVRHVLHLNVCAFPSRAACVDGIMMICVNSLYGD